MLAYGTYTQPTETVSDDTEFAIRSARSLVEQESFDGEDITNRFLEWYQSDPFDIALMTVDAIGTPESGMSWRDAGQEVWQQRPEGQNAGNGSAMRRAPYGITFTNGLESLIHVSRRSSLITHYDPRCMYRCAILNGTIAGYSLHPVLNNLLQEFSHGI